PSKNPTQDSTRANERKKPLGLARIEDIVGQEPELRGRNRPKKAYPNVHYIVQPWPADFQDPPEQKKAEHRGERGVSNQLVQTDPVGEPEIERRDDPHDQRNENVHVGKLIGTNLLEEKPITGRTSCHVRGDG